MDLVAKRVVVMGLGRHGGGVGVTQFLVEQGADVLVTDLLAEDRLQDSLAALRDLPVDFRLGNHNVSDFTGADLIIANPAVDPRDNRFLRAAHAAGVPITSEVRLLVERLPNRARTIGVTGTAGKSTVTSMIGRALDRCFPTDTVHVGGNLGGSLLGSLAAMRDSDWVVLELSSFMLEGLEHDRWSPHIAVVTNLWPNHLDRHGSASAYAAAKAVITRHQQPGDFAVLGPALDPEAFVTQGKTIRVGHSADTDQAPIDLMISGNHNQLNARLAIRAAECAGATPADASKALTGFAGLPHRLEHVGTWDGVAFYNDSKCTTPEGACLAIQSVGSTGRAGSQPTKRVHIILGGYDKHADLSQLASFAAKHCVAVYTIGATGDTIADEVTRNGGTARRCQELQEVVRAAVGSAQPGEIVLLSPGCASWDQFDDFEQRGRAFSQAVRDHVARRS